MAKSSGGRKAPKSAITGKFVSTAYAKSHPKTAYTQTIKGK